MNNDEFKTVMKDCIADHDVLISKGEDIMCAYSEMTESNETLKKEVEELKTKNDELRKECQKWMSRVSFGTTTEEDEKESYDEISKKFKEKLKGKN